MALLEGEPSESFITYYLKEKPLNQISDNLGNKRPIDTTKCRKEEIYKRGKERKKLGFI